MFAKIVTDKGTGEEPGESGTTAKLVMVQGKKDRRSSQLIPGQGMCNL